MAEREHRRVPLTEGKGAAAKKEGAGWKWNMHRAVVINRLLLVFQAPQIELT